MLMADVTFLSTMPGEKACVSAIGASRFSWMHFSHWLMSPINSHAVGGLRQAIYMSHEFTIHPQHWNGNSARNSTKVLLTLCRAPLAHHSSIVDQHIAVLVAAQERFGKLVKRLQVCEVDRVGLHLRGTLAFACFGYLQHWR